MMGRKTMEAISWLVDEVDIADRVTPEEYVVEYGAMLAEMFRMCDSMPGAERLVRHLASKGVPMAICSGSCSRTFALKAEKHRDWIDLIPIHVLSGDDIHIKRGKPFPDPFLETMKRFSEPPTDPSHVLVFEDAPNGVKAAHAAGMQCVMVPDPVFHEGSKLLCVENVLSSLEEFKPEEFGLPAFDVGVHK
ncbi:HAD hydrolase, family IA, variant 3 [Ostertagia ostertagi]